MSVIFFFANVPNLTRALGSPKPLTKTTTKNLPRDNERPARKADNLTAICEPNLDHVGASTAENP
jgi:hypothetical protein